MILNTIIAVCVSMLLPGIINRTRALLSGRRGQPLMQHVQNAAAAMRKGAVYSPSAGWLFRAAPAVYLASSLLALLIVPVSGLRPVLSFECDAVMFAYLLGLGRGALILAAMQTGSSFEGMGAAREALYGALVEPALFLILATLALLSGHTSLTGMMAGGHGFDLPLAVTAVMLAGLLCRILNTESGRIPVDDPRTHLELTMIHEVMVLDYSGADLAMIQIAGWFKTGAVALLAGDVLACYTGTGPAVATLAALCAGVSIGVTESLSARNRMVRNATYILSITAVAAVVLFVAFLLNGKYWLQ